MSEKLENLALRRNSIAIFRGLGKDNVISDLMYLLNKDTEDTETFLTYYADFVSSLYENNVTDISKYILKAVLENDNFYIRKSASGKNIPQEITECLINELQFFQELTELTSDDFLSEIDYDGFMPKWTNSPVDIVGSYMERLKLVHRYGYGKYAEYTMFSMNGRQIVPVKYPDRQKLSELYGYERERQAVIENTLALVNGKKAQNVLLYGDAGTGKQIGRAHV